MLDEPKGAEMRPGAVMRLTRQRSAPQEEPPLHWWRRCVPFRRHAAVIGRRGFWASQGLCSWHRCWHWPRRHRRASHDHGDVAKGHSAASRQLGPGLLPRFIPLAEMAGHRVRGRTGGAVRTCTRLASGEATVGNGDTDYSAEVAGTISSATGSFRNVSPTITETGQYRRPGGAGRERLHAFSSTLETFRTRRHAQEVLIRATASRGSSSSTRTTRRPPRSCSCSIG